MNLCANSVKGMTVIKKGLYNFLSSIDQDRAKRPAFDQGRADLEGLTIALRRALQQAYNWVLKGAELVIGAGIWAVQHVDFVILLTMIILAVV